MEYKPANRNSAVDFVIQSSHRRRILAKAQIALALKMQENNVSIFKTLKGSL